MISFPLTIIGFGSLLFFFKTKHPSKWMVLSQLIFIYTVFTFIANKNIRYLLPLLPFYSILIGFTLYTLIKRFKKIGILLTTCLFGYLSIFFVSVSFSLPLLSNKLVSVSLPEPLYRFVFFDSTSTFTPYAAEHVRSPIKDIISAIKTEKIVPNVLVVSNTPDLSASTMQMMSMNKYPLYRFRDVPDDRVTLLTHDNLSEFLTQFDFLIVPSASVGVEAKINYANMQAVRGFVLGGATRSFALIASYSLPNGETAHLLKNDPEKNLLEAKERNKTIILTRNPAVSRIYYQIQYDSGEWEEAYMKENETEKEIMTQNAKIIRIDYPPQLLRVSLTEWVFDGKNQLNKTNGYSP
jgi:hypothetical protein